MAQYHAKSNVYWLLGLIPLGLALNFARFIPRIAAGRPLAVQFDWIPDLNVSLSFMIDGLGLLMSLLVLGIGGLILIYASGYMAGNPQIARFYTILILFMAAMFGVVISDNLLVLFVFWELTSLTSFLLIGFNHENRNSQNSALQALLVTGIGGLCLLAGLILLGSAGGSYELTTLLERGDVVRAHPAYLPILVLVFLGCFTKSAQFPFHFWLPNAMAAPTPVSAYLHSATMVKAGVYLLARLFPILGGTEPWTWTLVLVGGVTGLLGGWLAWQQNDLKRIMAYTTISALGILVFLLGVGGKIGVKAMVLFLLIHSLYKGALFMTAGNIDHETGTRDVTRLGGLWRTMPFTGLGVGLAALSMAGLPPLLGFVGKEVIYEATLESTLGAVVLTGTAVLMNLFNVAAAGIVLFLPFFRPRPAGVVGDPIHQATWKMWGGPLVLGGLGVLAFAFVGGDFFGGQLIGPAASAVYGSAVEVKLHAFPTAWSIVPILSIITIAGGLAFYALHGRLKQEAVALDRQIARWGPERLYQGGLDGLLWAADRSSSWLQNGYLRRYILYVVLALVLFIGAPLVIGFDTLVFAVNSTPRLYEVIISLVILAASTMILFVRSRLAAVAALGVVGYGIAILFLYFNAPDLAMTQFSIETLTVILFVLVLYRLPGFVTFTSGRLRVRDAFIAGTAGLLMTVLVLLVTSVDFSRHVTDYFAQNSYKLAKGQNVVNVILVDFRGLDTMVEISVLAVAAVGVYALIRQAGQPAPAEEAAPVEAEAEEPLEQEVMG